MTAEADTSRDTPRTASNTRGLEEARKDPSVEPSEGTWPSRHLDFRLPASRAVRESSSIVLGARVCGTLLRQP